MQSTLVTYWGELRLPAPFFNTLGFRRRKPNYPQTYPPAFVDKTISSVYLLRKH